MSAKRGQLSRLDVLQANLAVDEDSADYIAQQLGLHKQTEQPIEAELDQEGPLNNTEKKERLDKPLERPSTPTDRPKTNFWYLHHRETKEVDKPSESLTPTFTPWLNRPITKPQHQPLADKRALLEKLHQHLYQLQPSHKIDVSEMVKTLSRGEYLQQIPKKSLKSEQLNVHLIDDRSRYLTSYWKDHHFASEVIFKHYAQAHGSLSVLLDGDERPQQLTGDGFGDWHVAPQSVVVIFSDLGCLNRYSARIAARWLCLGRELQRKQCKVIVLLPCAVSLLDPRFNALFHLLSWEHQTTVRQDNLRVQEQVERLLTALAPCIRIEPSLLRAMRLALQKQGEVWHMGAAVEASVWQHSAIQEPHSVAATWVIKARQHYLNAFEQLTDDEKTTVLDIIRQWRAALSEKIWYEEIISVADDTQQLRCIKADVLQAQTYFKALDKIFQNDKGLDGEPQTQAWFRRLYQRIPKQKLQACASLQRITERVYKDQTDFDRQWLNPQKLSESHKVIQQAVLYQKGNRLRLQRYQPFDLPSDGYSPLSLITLRREHVQVLSNRDVLGTLTLDDTQAIQLPTQQQLTIKSDEETLSLRTQSCLDTLEMGRDRYGLYTDIDLFGITQRFRYIEAGTFMMGSPSNQSERISCEDYHQVTLSQGYWLADTACTQALWGAVMGGNPSSFDDNLQNPVDSVSWLDIKTFLEWLNQQYPELHVQLPSEAQWEYACRAGTTTPFYFGDNIISEQINYRGTEPYVGAEKGEYRKKTVAVKTLPANQWGLYEMHGNVWEWCLDEWVGQLGMNAVLDPVNTRVNPDSDKNLGRVLRGGSWMNIGRDVCSAIRSFKPDDSADGIGFRFSLGYELQPSLVLRSEKNRKVGEQPDNGQAGSGLDG